VAKKLKAPFHFCASSGYRRLASCLLASCE
jgi:hypothetical protein